MYEISGYVTLGWWLLWIGLGAFGISACFSLYNMWKEKQSDGK